MAGSRLEKIGTIYTRVSGLISSRALTWEDRPLWYDIYEAFPPKEEPRFDRPAPKIPLRNIFYEEDRIRARFHQNRYTGLTNMSDNVYKSVTQKFLDIYKKLENQYDGHATEDQILGEALDMLKKERASKREYVDEEYPVSLSESFKSSLEENKDPSLNVKVTDIFKE